MCALLGSWFHLTSGGSGDKTRQQIYDEILAVLAAAQLEGVDLGAVGGKLNNTGHGTGMTQAIKWSVKYHRARSVHVTPTVFVNGLEAGVVSSGWTAEQWSLFLSPMGADNFTASKD